MLPAAVTVTFGAVKAGLVTGRGPELAGRVVLVDLGLATGCADEVPVGEATVDRVVDGLERRGWGSLSGRVPRTRPLSVPQSMIDSTRDRPYAKPAVSWRAERR